VDKYCSENPFLISYPLHAVPQAKLIAYEFCYTMVWLNCLDSKTYQLSKNLNNDLHLVWVKIKHKNFLTLWTVLCFLIISSTGVLCLVGYIITQKVVNWKMQATVIGKFWNALFSNCILQFINNCDWSNFAACILVVRLAHLFVKVSWLRNSKVTLPNNAAA